jgi:two-component system, NarL family, sensor histidine kinase YdfH
MGFITNLLANFWQLLSNPSAEQKEIMGEVSPFSLAQTLILGAVSIIVVYATPALQTPPALFGFIAVMLLHIGFHWVSGFSQDVLWMRISYLVIQSLLSLAAVLISGAPGIALALFATLIGETIGTHGTERLTWFSVIIYLALTPFSYFLVGGMETIAEWTQPTISTMIILIIFMVLLRKQIDASQSSQALAAELETANQQLIEYAEQVEELTLTTERQRMARELHDTLAQGVAGLVLQLEAVKAHLAVGRHDRSAEIIETSLASARSTLAESRAAIDDLRAIPENLPEAVRVKVERFTQATGVPCELNITPGDSLRVATTDDHILRVLDEALANITRHAQANHVWVLLTVEEAHIKLEIRDNGRGFDSEAETHAGHYGLLGMRERARLIGGNLTIISIIGEGTQIQLAAPIPEGDLIL